MVVRDAHRYPAARAVVTRLLTARPDAVVVEMGLPVWRPPGGAYVATYGAGRGPAAQAAAEAASACHRVLADPCAGAAGRSRVPRWRHNA